VKAHAVFIASLGDEATNIVQQLPRGYGHACMDTSQLPQLFRKLFTSHLG
jgi:hypothetical protein